MPAPADTTKRESRFTAAAVFAYCASYGLIGLVTVLSVIVDGPATGRGTSWTGTLVFTVWQLAAAVLVVVALMRYRPRSWPRPHSRGLGARGVSACVATYALALGLSVCAASSLAFLDDPSGPNDYPNPVTGIVGGLAAGIGEEVVVVVGPIAAALLGRPRIALRVLLPVLVAMRLIYHAYYGWHLFGLTVWAAVSVLLVYRWGCWRLVAGFVGVHAAYDATVSMPALNNMTVPVVGLVVVPAAALTVLGLSSLFRSRSRAAMPVEAPRGPSGTGTTTRSR